MSLQTLEDRRDPTVFGANLNVLLDDITINGDLDVNGLINGKSAQGQNTNNVWTGTNEWSVNRPQTIPVTGVGFSGVNVALKNTNSVVNSVINQGATWTGTNNFTKTASFQGAVTPVAGTDGVSVSNVTSAGIAKNNSYLTNNQTWTNANTFEVVPICIEPVANTEIATKNYVDTATTAVLGKALTTVSQTNYTDTWANVLATSVQLIGGGGGSTSGYTNNAPGWAGGGGSTASILILNRAIGGATQASWSIVPGTGGNPGIGSTPPQSYSGAGGNTMFKVTPLAGFGLDVTPTTVLVAPGGSGNQGSNGDITTGESPGGVYSTSLNPQVLRPLSFASGLPGTLGGGRARQPSGLNNIGWGGLANNLGNGNAGTLGGYGFTRFIG